MRRAALIYNPASGQRPRQRVAQIEQVKAVLEDAGVEVILIATGAPNSAGAHALQAIQDGCDTIIACGGDGTAHETLQTMVGGEAALGVIPMGTANALAMDLGIPSSPVKAAKALLAATPVRIPVGRVSFQDATGDPASRYFIVAAGVGADGVFFSRLDSRLKQRFGYLIYLIEAFRLWTTYTFPVFTASFQEIGNATPRTEQVSQLLAVRISDFGGLVRKLAPGAALGNGNLHVLAFKTRSRSLYLRFMLAVLFRRHSFSKTIELVDCVSVECGEIDGAAGSSLEADGEWLGILPARIEVVPQALTLLIPPKSRR